MTAYELRDDRAERRVLARELDHGAVHELYRHGTELHDMLRRLHGLAERRKVTDAEGFVFRQWRELQADAARVGERAFGADEQMRHVDRAALRNLPSPNRQQKVQVVTADPPQ